MTCAAANGLRYLPNDPVQLCNAPQGTLGLGPPGPTAGSWEVALVLLPIRAGCKTSLLKRALGQTELEISFPFSFVSIA